MEFWLKVGDRVHHVKDADSVGTVVHIDLNMTEGNSTTTCLVLWDYAPDGDPDIQWTNKLVNYRHFSSEIGTPISGG